MQVFVLKRDEEAYRPIKFYDVGAFVWVTLKKEIMRGEL